MKKTPLSKLIKWVVSGAMHPFALFDEALLRRQAVVELGPEYATKPLPWAFDEETTGPVITWALEGMLVSLRKHYKSEAHFRQHAVMISERILYVPETTVEDIKRVMEYVNEACTQHSRLSLDSFHHAINVVCGEKPVTQTYDFGNFDNW